MEILHWISLICLYLTVATPSISIKITTAGKRNMFLYRDQGGRSATCCKFLQSFQTQNFLEGTGKMSGKVTEPVTPRKHQEMPRNVPVGEIRRKQKSRHPRKSF